ncbi:hypothetical protein [Almyronema epifaneia]|uniref:Uncharacterized protein n=1 Tax=Almyronema epifaneia S1 TaxID=2991925 RepID=A0ABW6III3_9CYAN
MFEPIAAGIVAFVLFVWSVEMLGGGEKQGKPGWLPLPTWLFSKPKKPPATEEAFGKAFKAIIKEAINDAKGGK